MDYTEEHHFNDFIFPKLTEVTGFVLFYRARNLLNIGKMFPNLKLIRGQMLIGGYSFIIFDMPELNYINLRNLMYIENGSVRIERVPKLCDQANFHWNDLTNKKSRENNHVDPVLEGCPCARNSNCSQHMYPIPVSNLTGCHEQCLIGCRNSTADGCFSCKNLKNDLTCLTKCPDDK